MIYGVDVVVNGSYFVMEHARNRRLTQLVITHGRFTLIPMDRPERVDLIL